MKQQLTTAKFKGKREVLERITDDMGRPKSFFEVLKHWLNDDVYLPIPNAVTLACVFALLMIVSKILPPSATYYAYTITVYDALGNKKIY